MAAAWKTLYDSLNLFTPISISTPTENVREPLVKTSENLKDKI